MAIHVHLLVIPKLTTSSTASNASADTQYAGTANSQPNQL